MSFNYSMNRLQRAYLVEQTDPQIINNSSGAASVTASNTCVYTKLTLNPIINQIVRPDITGSRDLLQSMKGRQSGTWGMDMSLAGNGAAGVVPDCDPILQSLFGQAATISAGVSCTYALTDAVTAFSLYRFRTPAGLTNHIGGGSVVSECTFTLGPDIATLSAQGTSLWVLDSDNFSNFTTAAKMGLTSFPTEPGSPVSHGLAVIGFTGAITMDSGAVLRLKTATIKTSTGNRLIDDTFGSFTSTGVVGDERKTTVAFTLDDTDEAAIQNLKAKAFSQAAINMVLQVGTIAGNTWTWTLKNVQLQEPTYAEGNKSVFHLAFGESTAHGTSLTSLDSVSLVIT
jgi:hypothetical protein